MTAGPSSSGLRRLTKRAQFLNAARGQRAGRTGFSLQAIASDAPEPGVGLTVTIVAQSREQLDALYRELGAHPAVVMIL